MNADTISLFNSILLYVVNYTSEFEGFINGSGIKLIFNQPTQALEIFEYYCNESSEYYCWMHSSNNVEVNFNF